MQASVASCAVAVAVEGVAASGTVLLKTGDWWGAHGQATQGGHAGLAAVPSTRWSFWLSPPSRRAVAWSPMQTPWGLAGQWVLSS